MQFSQLATVKHRLSVGKPLPFNVRNADHTLLLARGQVVFNHLEALDHCPTTRKSLRERMRAEGLLAKVHIPDDGETLHFARPDAPAPARPRPGPGQRPGFQKWVTAHFTMT